MTGFILQPKPEDSHYVTIHNCYKDITDNSASTAALLSVLEYLAERSLTKSWDPKSPLPDSIEISGDCNAPLLIHLLDGMLKPTAIKQKLQVLKEKKFISTSVKGGSRRTVIYHRKNIANALSGWSKDDGSKSDRSKNGHQNKGDWSKSDALTGQKVTPTNHITNQDLTNPTLSLSDRTSEERECDASLQPAQPATQSEENHSPVQKKEQDPGLMGSASQGSGQAETVGQFQEKQSSAASLLENLKIQLNQLRDDYIPPAWRYEWRMAKALPWRDPRTGDIPESFSVFVGKKLMFKGDRESMTALEKGRNYVRNAEPKVAGMQGLIDYWEDYQRKLSPVKVVPINQKQEPPKSSPPPENWAKNALGARYRNAS